MAWRAVAEPDFWDLAFKQPAQHGCTMLWSCTGQCCWFWLPVGFETC